VDAAGGLAALDTTLGQEVECIVCFIFTEVETIYAIIETGGKQYKVTPGQTIDVERLDVAEGGVVELDRVLLIADGDKVTVGTPTVEGAKVKATSKGDGKGKKIIVFHYKPKVRYSKKQGHRQQYTRLTIDKIVADGADGAKKTAPRRKKEEVTASGA